MNISRIFLNKVLQSSLRSLSSLPPPHLVPIGTSALCPAGKSCQQPADPLQNHFPILKAGRKRWYGAIPRVGRAPGHCHPLCACPQRSLSGGLAPVLGMGLLGAMLLCSELGSVCLWLNRQR